MVYNLTAVSNTTGILDFMQKIDNNIFCAGAGCGGDGGLLGTAIIIILFGILMINFLSNGREFNSSLMAASFICSLAGGLLFLMELITPTAIYISVLVWAGSVAIGSRK